MCANRFVEKCSKTTAGASNLLKNTFILVSWTCSSFIIFIFFTNFHICSLASSPLPSPDFLHKHTFGLNVCVYIYIHTVYFYLDTHGAAAAAPHFCDGSVLKRSPVWNSFTVTLPKTCLLSLGARVFWRDGAKQERYRAGKHTRALKQYLHGADLCI